MRAAPILFVAALVLVAGAAAGNRVPTVSLAVAPGAVVELGATVQLTARAAVPAGGRLTIRQARGGSVVAGCRRSPCVGSFTGRTTGTVGFQAVVTRGGSTVARSRTVAVRFAQSPPAGAMPGVYEGRTSQNELIRFEITSDGSGLVNLQTGKINEGCLGPAGDRPTIRRGDIGPLAQTVPVEAGGTFSIRLSGPAESNGAPGSYELAIDGRVAQGAATGTLREDVTVGVYDCTSGDQSWTAVRTFG